MLSSSSHRLTQEKNLINDNKLTENHTYKVWIIDDDRSIRWVLERALTQAGYSTMTFDRGDAILYQLQKEVPHIILTDIRMPGLDGLGVLKRMQNSNPQIPVIIMTAHSDLDSAVASYKGGAFENLPKPFDLDEAVSLVNRAIENAYAKQAPSPEEPLELSQEIIGEAPSMQGVFRAIGRLSQSNITILINGKSGTGKGLVAQALHKHSPRRDRPFVTLNMAALPKDLIEPELFGHEKGALTNFSQQQSGRFEQANGGTLFLDEISDMPLETQTRLLRVLADGEFYRVGGHNPIRVDVRLIVATHYDLDTLVSRGQFREDLFHRLNVIKIQLPSLNQRREDIPKLAAHFLKKAAKELSVSPKILSSATEAHLCETDWPGNVRQLENLCRWLTVMATGREILLADLPEELRPRQENAASLNRYANWENTLREWADRQLQQGEAGILQKAVPAFERIMIEVALKHTSGRKRDAANLLGWGRNTLTRKIKELDMETSASPQPMSEV
ncbi:MAG: nitrogen regulation protein NR(I) [Gammaproteobacteria bacterium]